MGDLAATIEGVKLRWTVAITGLAAGASAAIGLLAGGSPLGLAAGLPPIGAGIWHAWRSYQQVAAIEEWIARQDDERRWRELAEIGTGDMRIRW